jgi:negative regulator of sigma E activity
MSPLESRKQLLIAESELNRAQLLQEFQTMTAEVHALARQARTITSFASATATLVAGVVSLRQKKSAPAPEKPSWLRTILKGTQLAGLLWSEFRARPKK